LGTAHPLSDVGHPTQYQCQCLLFFAAHLACRPLRRVQAPKAHSLGVFTSVIVIVCVGALVVTIQAKVSTDQCCICNSSGQSYAASASRWQGVRPIRVSLVSCIEECMCTGHSFKDYAPLATASPRWTLPPLSLALFAQFMSVHP